MMPIVVSAQKFGGSSKSSGLQKAKNDKGPSVYSTESVLKKSEKYQALLAAIENVKIARKSASLKCEDPPKADDPRDEEYDCFTVSEQLKKRQDSLEALNRTYYQLVNICVVQWKDVQLFGQRINQARTELINGELSKAYVTLDFNAMEDETNALLASKSTMSQSEYNRKAGGLSAEYIWKATLCGLDFGKAGRLDSVNYFMKRSFECVESCDRYFISGLVAYVLGDWKEAIRLNEAALKYATTNFSKALISRSLAYNYSLTEEDKKAEKHGKKAIAYCKAAFGESPEVNSLLQDAYTRLKDFYFERKRFDEARKVFEESLAYYEENFGNRPDYQETISDMYCDWGIFEFSLDQFSKSIEQHEKGLQYLETAIIDDLDYKELKKGILEMNIAVAYRRLKSPKAFGHYQSAILIYEKLYESDEKAYAARYGGAMRNYGYGLLWYGQFQDANSQFLRSTNLFLKQVKGGNLDLYNEFEWSCEALEYGRDSLFGQQSWSEATAIQQQRLDAILEVSETVPNLNAKIAEAYGSLAWHLIFEKSYSKAEAASRKALEYDDTLNWLRTNLGHALLYQGRYDEAIAVYQTFLETGENTEATRKMLSDDWEMLVGESVLGPVNLVSTHKAEVWFDGTAK